MSSVYLRGIKNSFGNWWINASNYGFARTSLRNHMPSVAVDKKFSTCFIDILGEKIHGIAEISVPHFCKMKL
jgi:hypothetical protein